MAIGPTPRNQQKAGGSAPSETSLTLSSEPELKSVVELYWKIRWFFGDGAAKATQRHTGTGQGLGAHSLLNSVVTAYQFWLALAMTQHPKLRELVSSSASSADSFTFEPLIDLQIMKGLKILDEGSGPIPVFARCCRELGATVWTADILALAPRETRFFSAAQREQEEKHHLIIDLKSPESAALIERATGGGFHLTTESHLTTSDCHSGQDIARQLLLEGGLHQKDGDIYWKCRGGLTLVPD